MKKTKLALLHSVIALLLCCSMLIGTTFAWFTDSVTSGVNRIIAGNLDVELEYLDENGSWKPVREDTNVFAEDTLWEPGHTEVVYLKISNLGSLALKYQLGVNIVSETPSMNVDEELLKLSDHIRYGVETGRDGKTGPWESRDAAVAAVTSSAKPLSTGYTGNGKLYAEDNCPEGGQTEHYVAMVVYMPETVGNEANYATGQNPPEIMLGISLVATQQTAESDSFGDDYDETAKFPVLKPGSVTADVKTEDGKVTEQVTMVGETISATVPAGVLVQDGVDTLTLSVSEMSGSNANISLEDNEILRSLDVHMEGVAANNTVPMLITVQKAMMTGLNIGNYTLYHVENGTPVEMTDVSSLAELDAHNEFYYNPETGDVTLAMATFSEVAMFANTVNPWNGNVDHSWYNADATELTIANADQLWSFSQIVGGMAKDTDGNAIAQDSFSGQTVKLISDINLGDAEDSNTTNIFYPIGYWNSEGTYEKTGTAISSGFYAFEGTFDGNGHLIANFYQNTWEMKGDHNWYKPEEQHYRDGMGLFGKVYGGTVKNLTVENFSSDGEITTTGVIAAYADGATFENIAIFNCNPRVYNIGNGGIVGCVGWYAEEADLKTTFKNITVDNSNKISALWGSYDVACGGIVGQYYPTSGQSSADPLVNAGIHFENCHVSAIMDVYNDVCANYQYYAYRYTGMLIGSVRENETIDGHVYPKMDGITASGCTVHFGTWNDYYYCEIIDNTTASYTHDYQMSRLTEIKAINGTTITYLDGTTGTVPASGRANYVIVDYTKGHGTENATCYHFKDGTVWNHEDAGYHDGTDGGKIIDENGDGNPDLREDKQHIYLEFNNLFTGYGWGVTSKGVGDLEGVVILDEVADNEGNSVVKFEGKVTELANGTEIKIGNIFKYILDEAGTGPKLIPGALTVSVTDLDDTDGIVTAEFNRNVDNWENGTLTLTGTGKVKITIQDYYFCTPTTITVEVKNAEDITKTERFTIEFPNTAKYLYRVGNLNAVPLNKLFGIVAGEEDNVGNISVDVETIIGASAPDAANVNLDSDTIQFVNTGVVAVTISDDNYSVPKTLYLEVVDAKNITSKADATANNVVLLNNISGGFTVSNGYAFYGNGFKVTCAGDGSYSSKALSYGYVTVKDGGILDNVQIICDIFPESYLYTKEMTADSSGRYPYGYSAVVVSGNSTISNSYIYGARNNIQVSEGNVTVENTVLECGSLSNIHIKSSDGSTVTLENVTTVQYRMTSSYDTSKTVLGFGILVGTNESTSNAKLVLKGDLKQYNWVTSDDTSVSNTYASAAINAALDDTTYQHTINGKNSVNMSIACLNTKTLTVDNQLTNGIAYKHTEEFTMTISSASITGQVYAIGAGSGIGDDGTVTGRIDATTDGMLPYTPSASRQIMPQFVFTGTANDALSLETAYDKTEGRWVTKFTVDLDNIDGGTYTFKFSDIKVQKYGVDLEYTVMDSNGNTVSKDSTITLNQMLSSEYTLEITDNQIYGANGTKTDASEPRTCPFVLYATKTSIDPPKFTNAGTATAIRLVTSYGGDWRPAYTVLTGVSVTYWSASESKVKTVDLSTLYNSGTISSNVWTYTCDDYTLTITGGAVHSDGSVITPVVANNTLYFASTNKAFTTGTTSRNIVLTYVFTDKNASTTWNRTETVTYSELNEYDYNSFMNSGTLTEVSSSGSSECITGDTLITLADGTQKRIDEVSYSDSLLVWDFFNGEYAVVPAALIVNHGYGDQTIIKLTFEDGTTVKAIGAHSFFDADTSKWELINAANAHEYIAHAFVQADGDGYTTTKLVNVEIYKEHTESFSLVSACHYNFITENMFSLTNSVHNMLAGLVVGENMTYDLESDVAEYGLYTYEDFADYITYEQYVAFNGDYLKISVEKGYITFDDILALVEEYL